MKKNYIAGNISETFTTTFDHQFDTIEEHNLRNFWDFLGGFRFFFWPSNPNIFDFLAQNSVIEKVTLSNLTNIRETYSNEADQIIKMEFIYVCRKPKNLPWVCRSNFTFFVDSITEADGGTPTIKTGL